MQDLLLPFARQVDTGEVVSVEDVPRGKACGCVCMFCDVPVLARKGGVNREHFAHVSKVVDDDHECPASFERCVFWMARRILEHAREIELPEYIKHFHDFSFGIKQAPKITDARRLTYDAIKFPFNMDSPRHDAALIQVKGYVLAVTMTFGEAMEYRGPFQYEGQQLPHLLIQMSPFDFLFRERKTGFRTIMEERLLDALDGKQWLYHPNEEPHTQRFKSEVKEASQRDKKQRMQYAQKRREAENYRRSARELDRKEYRQRVKERLATLVTLVKTIRSRGYETGYLCDNCMVMRFPIERSCIHCNSDQYSVTTLSDEYISHLDRKYDCKNYPEKSLKAAPELNLLAEV